MNKKSKKLGLRKETVRALGANDLNGAAGGLPTLSFGMGCNTANCMTLGQYCSPTNNCMTLGEMCRTAGCGSISGCGMG